MARKRAQRRPTRSKPSSWRLSSDALKRTWVGLGWLTALLLLVGGMHYVEDYARRTADPVPCRLEWENVPPWMEELTFEQGARVLDTITEAVDLPPDADVFAPELTAWVGQRVMDSPWVERVERVAKQADGTVRVRAEFREPVAFVVHQRWAYLVDEAGHWLGPRSNPDFVRPDQWYVIIGAEHAAPSEAGERWIGNDVAAGLQLVRYLRAAEAQRHLNFRDAIRSVDVANYNLEENAFDGRLRIQTVYPYCYIRWGEPPGEEYPIETRASRKLDMLRSLYADRGGFPEGRLIEVRDEGGIRLLDHPRR